MFQVLLKHDFLDWLSAELDVDKDSAESFAMTFIDRLYSSGGLEVVDRESALPELMEQATADGGA